MNFITNTSEKKDNYAKLLFTETDSSVYDIDTDDVYENFY